VCSFSACVRLRARRPVARKYSRATLIYFSELNDADEPNDSRSKVVLRSLLRLRADGIVLPEETALFNLSARGRGIATGTLVDSLGFPRHTFGRLAPVLDAMAADAVYLERALGTALTLVSVDEERFPERCRYVWGRFPPRRWGDHSRGNISAFLRHWWSPLAGWQHPWKLSGRRAGDVRE
jgi:hypothetical protein